LENYDYLNPVRLLYGKGQIANLGKLILPYGKKVLLVYGQKHLKETGVYSRITNTLKSSGITIVDLEGVHSNPRLHLVKKGIQICRDENIDFILAVGGGSSSDSAKAIGIGTKVNYDIWQAYEDFHSLMHMNEGQFPHVPTQSLPIGVVMTKAATGSEFDYTAVLSNRDTKEKLMVINKVLYPKFAIQDPTLTFTLPKEQIAFGIADIMTHYMEQYFVVQENTLILDRTKEAGLKTVIEAGKAVMANPQDYVAQSYLLYCAAWACSDQSMTGALGAWASHQIEHEISAITDLNHGHGMAIVYLGWMKYVHESLLHKFARFAEKVWSIKRGGKSDSQMAAEGIEKTTEFWKSLGITLNLSDAGVDESVIPEAAKQAVRFGPLGFIKQLTEDDVVKILESVK